MSTERMLNTEELKNYLPAGAKKEANTLKEKKEALFKAVLINELHDILKQSMEDVDLDESEIESFFEAVSQLSDEEALAVMALPLELRERVFGSFAKRLKEGRIDVVGFLEQLRRNVEKNGYKMGFHVSNSEIQPREIVENGQAVIKWDIEGTEEDHRDQDLRRAYYSLDYMNLYRKKSGNYLYLVRAETGEDSSHRTDNDGSWGRASALPIVGKLVMSDVDQKIDEIMSEEKQKKN